MSVSNNIYPHTRAEDERLVRRDQTSFGSGMVRDVDPVDVPQDGLYDLTNMRATENGISGRTGSYRWSGLRIPYEFEGFAADISEDTLTLVSGQTGVFDVSQIGYLLTVAGSRTALVVTDVISPYEILFTGNIDEAVSSITFDMRGPISASYVDDLTGSSYYMIGIKVYGRLDGATEWTEYAIGLNDTLHSSASTFYKINKFVCLSNKNGIYILNDIEDSPYIWKANSEIPQFKLNRTIEDTSSSTNVRTKYGSRYNYSYGYTRIKDSFTGSRLNIGTFIQRESAPFLYENEDVDNDLLTPVYRLDGNNQDYTTISTLKPCGCTSTTTLEVRASASSFSTVYYLKDDSYISIIWNGQLYYPRFKFNGTATWDEITAAMQTALNLEISSDARVSHKEIDDTVYFDIYSIDPEDIITYDTDARSTEGYNCFASIPAANSQVFNVAASSVVNNVVKYLKYPVGQSDVTHYTLYRSADIYPHTLDVPDPYDERIQNKPELQGYVNDIPVCKVADCIVNFSGRLTIPNSSSATFDIGDVGNVISFGAYTAELTDYDANDETFGLSIAIPSLTSDTAYFGASRLLSLAKTGNTITVSPTDFSSEDIGKLIYWYDGSYSIITGLTIASGTITEVITADSRDISTGNALLDPTYRVYNDTLSDAKLNGYISSFPMSMRYFDEMPSTNIASYTRGILLSANRDENLLSYSDATDIARIGYKNSNSQINNAIQDGVKSIVNVHGYFTICTSSDTFLINPAQSQTIGNPDLGEAYTQMPDPILSSSGIGSTHQTKWTEGLNEGLIAVTNEPALRIYNGTQYGEDLSEGLVKRTELQNMDSMIIVGFDPNSGIYLWGRGV